MNHFGERLGFDTAGCFVILTLKMAVSDPVVEYFGPGSLCTPLGQLSKSGLKYQFFSCHLKKCQMQSFGLISGVGAPSVDGFKDKRLRCYRAELGQRGLL